MSLISKISAPTDTALAEFSEYATYLSHKTESECVDAMYKADKNTHTHGKRDKRGHTLFTFFKS